MFDEKEKTLLREVYRRSYLTIDDFYDIARRLGLSKQSTERMYSEYLGLDESKYFVILPSLQRFLPKIHGNVESVREELRFLIELILLNRGIEPTEGLTNLAYDQFRKWYEKYRKRRQHSFDALKWSAYLAARRLGIPINLRSDQWRSQSYLDLFRTVNGFQPAQEPPYRYVPYLCTHLHLSDRVKEEAGELGKRVMNKIRGISINPLGFSVGLVYISSALCGEKMTQKEVAKASDVTELTVRNWVKKILDADEETKKRLKERGAHQGV